jgi:TPR repeat protein
MYLVLYGEKCLCLWKKNREEIERGLEMTRVKCVLVEHALFESATEQLRRSQLPGCWTAHSRQLDHNCTCSIIEHLPTPLTQGLMSKASPTAAPGALPANPQDFDVEDLGEHFERECEDFDGDAGACFAWGEWHAVVRRDFARARDIYERNCAARDNANSCFSLVDLYMKGPGGLSRDVGRAREMAAKACDLGHTRGCDAQGNTWLARSSRSSSGGDGGSDGGSDGGGFEPNYVKARDSFAKACAREWAPSCMQIGWMHLKGQLSEDGKPDARSARPFMERSCNLGTPAGCHTLAVMYKRGDGVRQDEEKFAHYAQLTKDLVKATGSRLGVSVAGM